MAVRQRSQIVLAVATLFAIGTLSGCAFHGRNGTLKRFSLNRNHYGRFALIYDEVEHRPADRDRVEYWRWLHGEQVTPLGPKADPAVLTGELQPESPQPPPATPWQDGTPEFRGMPSQSTPNIPDAPLPFYPQEPLSLTPQAPAGGLEMRPPMESGYAPPVQPEVPAIPQPWTPPQTGFPLENPVSPPPAADPAAGGQMLPPLGSPHRVPNGTQESLAPAGRDQWATEGPLRPWQRNAQPVSTPAGASWRYGR